MRGRTRIGTATGVLAAALVLTACGDGGTPEVSESVAATPTDSVVSSVSPTSTASRSAGATPTATSTVGTTSTRSAGATDATLRLTVVEKGERASADEAYEIAVTAANSGTAPYAGHVFLYSRNLDTTFWKSDTTRYRTSDVRPDNESDNVYLSADLGNVTVAPGRERVMKLSVHFGDPESGSTRVWAEAGDVRSASFSPTVYPVVIGRSTPCALDATGGCTVDVTFENVTDATVGDVVIRASKEDFSHTTTSSSVTWTIKGATSTGLTADPANLPPGRTIVRIQLEGFVFDDAPGGARPGLQLASNWSDPTAGLIIGLTGRSMD